MIADCCVIAPRVDHGGAAHVDVEVLRDPEIDELDPRPTVRAPDDEQVARLEIPMDDGVRVDLGEHFASLEEELDGHLPAEPPLLVEDGAEVFPIEVFHHHVGRAVVERPDVIDTGDVLIAQADRGAALAGERRRRDSLIAYSVFSNSGLAAIGR